MVGQAERGVAWCFQVVPGRGGERAELAAEHADGVSGETKPWLSLRSEHVLVTLARYERHAGLASPDGAHAGGIFEKACKHDSAAWLQRPWAQCRQPTPSPVSCLVRAETARQ